MDRLYPFGADPDFEPEFNQEIACICEVNIPQYANMTTSTGICF